MVNWCPYGPLLVLPAFCTVAATLFVWMATFDCSFFEFSSAGTRDASISVGLWTVEDFNTHSSNLWDTELRSVYGYGSCSTWKRAQEASTGDLDAPLKAARAFSIIACLLSLPLLVSILLPSCMKLHKTHLYLISSVMFIEGFFTMLCLVALKSQWCQESKDCHIDTAGILCILGSLLWFVAAMSTPFLQYE